MKKSIYTFGICLAIGLSSCSGSVEGMADDLQEMADDAKAEMTAEPTIVGDWGLSDFDMGMEIPEGQEEMFEGLKNEMIANSTMSFKEDGTYSQKDMMNGEERIQSGTYSVEGDQLNTTTSEGVETSITISSLTETEAAFSMDEGGNTMTMTFTRK